MVKKLTDKFLSLTIRSKTETRKNATLCYVVYNRELELFEYSFHFDPGTRLPPGNCRELATNKVTGNQVGAKWETTALRLPLSRSRFKYD